MKKGVLLINLGTPEQPTTRAVRRYLRPFLLDKRVITLPALLRYILVYGLILPFRPKRSAHAYQLIWTDQGSPLLSHSRAIQQALQEKLSNTHFVTLGMRYGEPSLLKSLETLKQCDSLTIVPLYPQYASSSSGSAIEAALNIIKNWDVIPELKVIRDFYQNPSYIQAMSEIIKPSLENNPFVLFSYHGVPKNHLKTKNCLQCENACTPPIDTQCYRAQCFQTSTLIAKSLNLTTSNYQTAFQSRLGRTPWIEPYTDQLLIKLAKQGVKDLVIVCPSFVTDCLETIEEIGMRGKETWEQLTSGSFTLIPSLNNHPLFIQTISDLIS